MRRHNGAHYELQPIPANLPHPAPSASPNEGQDASIASFFGQRMIMKLLSEDFELMFDADIVVDHDKFMILAV
ncbi:hypothetical protein ILYODFUR_025747 [Ilyodon furcidens]|uniref:Uncharacterized protein n=1 Tax=Ilyodon furcidens TaxID=33524 RepID=A0ABV0TCI3_9TELE